MHNMNTAQTEYAIHFGSQIFSESGLKSYGEVSIIHSFAHTLYTVLLVLRTQVAHMHRDWR